jgi:hypothetical protein
LGRSARLDPGSLGPRSDSLAVPVDRPYALAASPSAALAALTATLIAKATIAASATPKAKLENRSRSDFLLFAVRDMPMLLRLAFRIVPSFRVGSCSRAGSVTHFCSSWNAIWDRTTIGASAQTARPPATRSASNATPISTAQSVFAPEPASRSANFRTKATDAPVSATLAAITAPAFVSSDLARSISCSTISLARSAKSRVLVITVSEYSATTARITRKSVATYDLAQALRLP